MRQASRFSPGQQSLALVEPVAGHLPALDLAAEWKAQQRLWGHSFHPMCSYLAMFPAGLAHAFIARYSRPGDVVLDPFSGRGTTALQACAEGRVGVGTDLNPMAHLLTGAKVEPPTRAELSTRLTMLRLRWSAEAPRWERLAIEALAAPGPGGVAVPPASGRGTASPLP
ncbi:MAG: DNA methyltransferase, partial [Candidatus Limnocylindrales bacterium]